MSTISNNPYNEGALAGRYALAGLDNTNRFSNYVAKAPRRTRIITTNDDTSLVVTLKEGSTYVLPGFDSTSLEYVEELKTITSASSTTIPKTSETPLYVFYNYEGSRLEYGKYVKKEEVTPQTGFCFYYDESVYQFKNQTNERCSFPLGYIDNDFKFNQFHSFGFFGNNFFVQQGVEIIIPDGKDDFSNMKTRRINFTKSVITPNTVAYTTDSAYVIVDSTGKAKLALSLIYGTIDTVSDGSSYIFIMDENILRNNVNEDISAVVFCSAKLENGIYTTVNQLNTLAPAYMNKPEEDAVLQALHADLLEKYNELLNE